MAPSPDLRIERAPAPIRTQVVDRLREAITTRRFQPGQRLVERELIALTGVSRTSIREALRELAAEGLVTSVPNRGTVVTTVSAPEAAELYEIRAELEALAGRLFVERATERQRSALHRALGRCEKAAATPGDLNGPRREFVGVLLDGAANASLHAMVDGLHTRTSVLRSRSMTAQGRAVEIVDELRAIVRAVDDRDAAAAAAACRFSVEQATRHGLAQLDPDSPAAG